MRNFLKYWLPLLLWIGVMAIASSDLMSATHTSRFLIPFIRWLIPDISPETLATIHFLWRKSAHVAEYAILAVLLSRAVRSTNWQGRVGAHVLLILAASITFAALDEFHQSFVATRGAAVGDVLIDSCGAAIGVALCWWWAGRRIAARSATQN